MIYRPSDNGIEQRTKDWIYVFSGDAGVRSKEDGSVRLICDGFFGQEQYVAEFGKFDNSIEIVNAIQTIMANDPRYAVKPMDIVMSKIAEMEWKVQS